MSAAKTLELEAGLPRSEWADGVIVTTMNMAPEEMIRILQTVQVSHIVQKDSIFFAAEMCIAQAMTECPLAFVNDPLGFIFESVHQAEGSIESASIHTLTLHVQPSEKKSVVLGHFDKFISQIQGLTAIRDQAFIVADELYTNGIKNAWPTGTNRSLSPPTRDGQVEFFAGSDGKRLIIGCRDSFGLLGFEQILRRIQICYEQGVAQAITQNESGAGIGSFMIFNSSVSYYAGVDPGHHTVVCANLPIGVRARKLSKLSKNIHLVKVNQE